MAMVQEVFNEHKLPPEFASKVLANVPRLRFDKGECTLVGAIVACMQFLNEDVTYDYVMGTSGGAFKLLFWPTWCPSSGDLALLGEEPVRRAFNALGHRYQYLRKTGYDGEEASFRSMIRDSIGRGMPVLLGGVIGPETCIVAGFDEEAAVLLGHSYFHDGSKGYYRKAQWFSDCWGLVVVGEKKPLPPRGEILRDSLAWALELARVPQRLNYASGLAAYDAWAAALLRDDFPQNDLGTLTHRCLTNGNVVHCVLLEARRSAAGFLRSMTDVTEKAAPHLLAAATAYEEEAGILKAASNDVPYDWSPEEKRLQMADPALRRRLADVVLQAKAKDEQAVARVEQALEAMD
jgi:hypothetical protein